MASIASSSHLPALEEPHERSAVAREQDVLIEIVRALEEQRWMLRVQLGSRVLAGDGAS